MEDLHEGFEISAKEIPDHEEVIITANIGDEGISQMVTSPILGYWDSVYVEIPEDISAQYELLIKNNQTDEIYFQESDIVQKKHGDQECSQI